ncbi:nitronate monooxygenase [Desulfonatronum thiosulfatophilum]|uniref:Nitronate monooxygenase n=1 Tax=Desulfonatronum thiosulfatophilum TaxID=617002 RepID=A0A1G6DNU7_9BACT|nr:nitronate monooxygenase family protein [Desulfonatronum thiosulfatophilum]SDB46792.1 nitronate monooxygenase [Desulfonatronum thiosulfatophilum]
MTFPSLSFGDMIAKTPIVQGGMGVGISLSGLSSAVANQGGIGVISAAMIGMNEPDLAKNYTQANIRALQDEIRKAKAMTKGILGVNIMVALSNFADLVRTSIQERIDIIFSGAGLPFDLPKYLTEDSHTKLVPIVSSGRAAAIICKKWISKFNYVPDGFVVEGPMAGGHLGFKAEQLDDPEFQLENLVPQVIEAVKPFEREHNRSIPVIAAGGIFSGADICKYLRMGAAGVQLGTRFVATHECDADMAFKQAFIDAKEGDVTVIKSPVGMPGRALKNVFLDDVDEGKRKPFKCPYHCIVTCDIKKSPYCIAQALANAKKGRMKLGFAFAGQTAHRVDKLLSVKELMDSLEAEYNEACAGPAPTGN